MTVTASGPITLSNLATEFSDSAPYSLSEYYAGGSLVPTGLSGIPASGLPISLHSFYGASNDIDFSLMTSNKSAVYATTAGSLGLIVARSDNTVYALGTYSSNASSSQWYPYLIGASTNVGTVVYKKLNTYVAIASPNVGYNGMVVDSSNNLYVSTCTPGYQAVIYKYNSSNVLQYARSVASLYHDGNPRPQGLHI